MIRHVAGTFVLVLAFHVVHLLERYELTWSGGAGVAPGQSTTITFSMLIPNSTGNFTVRGTPSPVPEPSTIALLSVGVLGVSIGWLRKRRHR